MNSLAAKELSCPFTINISKSNQLRKSPSRQIIYHRLLALVYFFIIFSESNILPSISVIITSKNPDILGILILAFFVVKDS
jgi:hypothetical protein